MIDERTVSFQGKLKRYLLILERVGHLPTFAELKDHLEEHGFAISPRTLQRDIEQIRVELGLEIGYDRVSNTYQLPDAADDRATIMAVLQRAVLGEMLGASGPEMHRTAKHVVFERKASMQGLQHWPTLLRAVKEQREVLVSYRRFQSEADIALRMRPCLLKEYRDRWYVLGAATGYAQPISLGLDRVVAVQITAKRFAAKERTAIEDFYAHVIGVDASPGRAEHIVLRFTALQGKYVKALPLHHSQRVLRDDAKGCELELFVMPNYELRQELLGLGSAVEVLEPAALRKAIAAEHRKAIPG